MADGIKRPQFYEGKILHAQDLQDLQATLTNRQARHARLLHGWGVVHGLVPRLRDTSGREIIISPGMAIDGRGRELIVSEEIIVTVERFGETARPWLGQVESSFPVFVQAVDRAASPGLSTSGVEPPTAIVEEVDVTFGRPDEISGSTDDVTVGLLDDASAPPDVPPWRVLIGYVSTDIHGKSFTHATTQPGDGQSPRRYVSVVAAEVSTSGDELVLRLDDSNPAVERPPIFRLGIDEKGDGQTLIGLRNSLGGINTLFRLDANGDLFVKGRLFADVEAQQLASDEINAEPVGRLNLRTGPFNVPDHAAISLWEEEGEPHLVFGWQRPPEDGEALVETGTYENDAGHEVSKMPIEPRLTIAAASDTRRVHMGSPYALQFSSNRKERSGQLTIGDLTSDFAFAVRGSEDGELKRVLEISGAFSREAAGGPAEHSGVDIEATGFISLKSEGAAVVESDGFHVEGLPDHDGTIYLRVRQDARGDVDSVSVGARWPRVPRLGSHADFFRIARDDADDGRPPDEEGALPEQDDLAPGVPPHDLTVSAQTVHILGDQRIYNNLLVTGEGGNNTGKVFAVHGYFTKSLMVGGLSILQDRLLAQNGLLVGKRGDAAFDAALEVLGKATVRELEVSGDATIGGNVSFEGIDASSASINGALGAQSLTVDGESTFNGPLRAVDGAMTTLTVEDRLSASEVSTDRLQVNRGERLFEINDTGHITSVGGVALDEGHWSPIAVVIDGRHRDGHIFDTEAPEGARLTWIVTPRPAVGEGVLIPTRSQIIAEDGQYRLESKAVRLPFDAEVEDPEEGIDAHVICLMHLSDP